MSSVPEGAVLGVMMHPDAGRDVAHEFKETVNHLQSRRSPAWDFDDIARQERLFIEKNYTMHGTGMLDSFFLIWNVRNGCAIWLSCAWHNQIAFYSMREQLNALYVIERFGFTSNLTIRRNGDFTALANFTYVRIPNTATLAYVPWPERLQQCSLLGTGGFSSSSHTHCGHAHGLGSV
jgi:hypothetical protein